MHAVGRIAYRGAIDNVQASWVKCGVRGARQILQAGANDLGGTLMDENISRAAGASHGQELDEARVPRDRRAARPHRSRSARRCTAAPRPWAAASARSTSVPVTAVTLGREEPVESASDSTLLAIGNALVDVLVARRRRRSSRAPASSAATMATRRRRPAPTRSTRRWARTVEISGGSAGNTAAGVASFGGNGRVHRPGRRRHVRQGVRPRPAQPRRALRRAARGRAATADRSLPRDRHARRASARCARTSAPAPSSTRPTSTKPSIESAAVTYLEGYLWDPSPRQGRGPAASLGRAPRRQPRRVHALRPVLRRSPPRRVPRARRAPTSTSSSRTRTRSCRRPGRPGGRDRRRRARARVHLARAHQAADERCEHLRSVGDVPAYFPNAPTAGLGETVALVGLGLALVGLRCRSPPSDAAPGPLLSSTRCPSSPATPTRAPRRARGVPVSQRARAGDLRRQGEVDSQARRLALLRGRAGAIRGPGSDLVADDRPHRGARRPHRGRGAARRAELHQAVQAALQHPPARRQVLPVHRDQARRGFSAGVLHARAPPP